jgi:ribulose-5-phosphate 4-epimerase/fuculose-1-phosphate aldolase
MSSEAMLTRGDRAIEAEREGRIDLAAAHRIAVLEGLHEGTWNHFSLAVPGDPERMLITPGYIHWSQVTASGLRVLGPDAAAVEAEGGITWIGYRIHYPIHQLRPDAACVVHAHPPYATALACLEDSRLDMAEQNALTFAGRIAYNDVYDRAVATDLGAGRAMVEALDGKDVLFLANHGVLVVGPTVAAALTDLYVLERACRVQLIARASGGALRHVPEDVVAAYEPSGGYRDHHFAAMKRVLDATQPDYRD